MYHIHIEIPRKMHIDVRECDGSYLPQKVSIRAGKELNHMKDINTVSCHCAQCMTLPALNDTTETADTT